MKTIPEIPTDKVVLLNITRCYNADEKEEDIYKRSNVYGYLRCSFEGVEVEYSKYLGLKVSDYVRSQNPVTYINC